MIFKTLKDKCEYYRSLTDYRLLPNGYVLVMIDGKNFSSLIKNKFEKPFDNWFISVMNSTCEHLLKNIQGCVGGFVQSDEISLLIKDTPETCLPFDGRMCKLLSIIPAFATSHFTKEIIKHFIFTHPNNLQKGIEIKTYFTPDFIDKLISDMKDYVFDCKVWNVPSTTPNEAFSWFLYRQIDCVRNSKQQFCQTYLPHKKLMKKNTDEQVQLCIEETGHDWNEISDDKKYGRFFFKDSITKVNDNGEEYKRHIWNMVSIDLTDVNNREWLKETWFEDEQKETNI